MKLKFIDPKIVRIPIKISVDKIKVVDDLFNDLITLNPDDGIWSINNVMDKFELLNDVEFSRCCNLAKQNNMELLQKSDNYQTTTYILKVIE